MGFSRALVESARSGGALTIGAADFASTGGGGGSVGVTSGTKAATRGCAGTGIGDGRSSRSAGGWVALAGGGLGGPGAVAGLLCLLTAGWLKIAVISTTPNRV